MKIKQQTKNKGVKMALFESYGTLTQSRACSGCGRRMEVGESIYHGDLCKTCHDKKEHKDAKIAAEKCLKKWKKEVEKRNKDIERLEDAIASGNVSQMDMARHRGSLGCLGKIVKFLFIMPSIGFWIIVIVGIYAYTIHPKLSTAANDTNPSSQVESSVAATDYVAEYHTVARAVVDAEISANPDRKMQLLEALKKNIEAFDKLSKEEQSVKLEKMKAKLKEMHEKTVNK